MAITNQQLEADNRDEERELYFYAHALSTDDFDLTIRSVPDDDPRGSHSKVDLVFFQDKVNGRREAVSVVTMQLHDLERLSELVAKKILGFRGQQL